MPATLLWLFALQSGLAAGEPSSNQMVPHPPCGSPPHSEICLGRIDVPEKQREVFNQAARAAIDALYSDQFERDLTNFIATNARSGEHAEKWRGVEGAATIARLRRGVQGQEVSTFGGIRGWWKQLVFHNTASDGGGSGPVLFNRAALPRAVPSLANTIAHEVAHRIGLSHRWKGRSDAAHCEPPYVIGSLVEKAIVGSSWRPTADDCSLLR